MKKYKWNNVRIRDKMLFLNIGIFIIVCVILVVSSYYINRSVIINETGENGIVTLNAIEENLKYTFNDVSLSADYVYFDNSIQKALKNINKKPSNIETQTFFKDKLINMLLGNEYLSSINLIDTYGNIYSSDRADMLPLDYDEISKTDIFKKMEESNGDGIFLYDSEDTIKFRNAGHSIVYVRQILDLDTYNPIAGLVATIDTENISNYFKQIVGNGDENIYIFSDTGEYIAGTEKYKNENFNIENDEISKMAEYQKIKVNGCNYVLISKKLDIQDWNLISLKKIDNNYFQYTKYISLVVVIGFICIFFILSSMILLNEWVFEPLLKLERHMMRVDEGNLSYIPMDNKKNEITNLQLVYNHMIQSIQNLIEKVKDEEKTIAKGELRLIQAQINPHFLYNTLDAISALSLINENKKCFQMTQALGNFYRNSLNNGKNTVTIREEMECIENYIIVLNFRHNNKIVLESQVEERLLDVIIPKLLIQPLVENAALHGLKEKKGADNNEIDILIFSIEDEIIITVKDNGIGMTQEQIDEIKCGVLERKKGFGIYSLKRRIELLYGIKEPIIIHSEPGTGTEINICIGREIKA